MSNNSEASWIKSTQWQPEEFNQDRAVNCKGYNYTTWLLLMVSKPSPTDLQCLRTASHQVLWSNWPRDFYGILPMRRQLFIFYFYSIALASETVTRIELCDGSWLIESEPVHCSMQHKAKKISWWCSWVRDPAAILVILAPTGKLK